MKRTLSSPKCPDLSVPANTSSSQHLHSLSWFSSSHLLPWEWWWKRSLMINPIVFLNYLQKGLLSRPPKGMALRLLQCLCLGLHPPTFPWWLSLQRGRPGIDPWVGKIPWKGNSYPLQYFGLENSMDWESNGIEGWALSPWVHEESDTTEQFSVSLSLPYQNRDFGTLKYRLPSRWELAHVIWHLHCRRWDSDQTWGRYLYALIHGSSVAFFRGFGLLSQRKLINTCATFVGQLTSLEMFISHSDIKEV